MDSNANKKEVIVWALFDSDKSCAYHALKDMAKIYSFGIGKSKVSIPIDLGKYEHTIEALEKYPSPDIILASPPCTIWSIASASNRSKHTKEHGFNYYWDSKFIRAAWIDYNDPTYANGIHTAGTLRKIIVEFSPKIWLVENPKKSALFDYLKSYEGLNFGLNEANFYQYGFKYSKPTIFAGNVSLLLNSQKVKGITKTMSNSVCKNKRSIIPLNLYVDIFNQCKAHLEYQKNIRREP